MYWIESVRNTHILEFSFVEYKTEVLIMKTVFSFVWMAVIKVPQNLEMCSLLWRYSARAL